MSDGLWSAQFEKKQIRVAEVQLNVRVGGNGPPLLLLHGYPQNLNMWHLLAPKLAERFTVVCADLRGYGDSDKPTGLPDHSNYSKRAMAADMAELMTKLGFEKFAVAGHDRGARVAHRLMLDHPNRVVKGCVMDIAPTWTMFKTTDQTFATAYYHWFFLIQPDGLPERLVGNDPEYYLREKLRRWSVPGAQFEEAAVVEYVRTFSTPQGVHASCEDYRAAATIDLQHDEEDMDHKVQCPLLVLWGESGFVGRNYEVLNVWRDKATQVIGHTVPGGHFLPEESPEAVCDALMQFLDS